MGVARTALSVLALMALAGGPALSADMPTVKLHAGKDKAWIDPSMPASGAQGWDLGGGARLNVTSRLEEDEVHLSADLTAPGKPPQHADLVVPLGGEGGMAFASGHSLKVSVGGAESAEDIAAPLFLTSAPEAIDIEKLRGKLTDLKPNKTVITVKLPKLNAGQIEKFWTESGEPRPVDPNRLADRPYVQFLDSTTYQGRPGGRRSHIPEGFTVDTFGSIRLGTGGSGKVFDSTNTPNGGTMQIGPEMLGGVRYTSFTRYDIDEPGYVTLNRVIVVDGEATLIRGLKAKLGTMTTYALPGGHVASLMPVMRRVGEANFRGEVELVAGNMMLPPGAVIVNGPSTGNVIPQEFLDRVEVLKER